MPAGDMRKGHGSGLCDEIEASLSQLVEEELSVDLAPGRREALLAHAVACARCGESLRSYRALLSGLKSLPAIPAPSDFARRVEESLQSERAFRPGGSWVVLSRVLPLAAMVVVGAAVMFAVRDRPRVDGPKREMELAQAPQPVGEEEAEADMPAFEALKEKAIVVASSPPPPAAPLAVESSPIEVQAKSGAAGLRDAARGATVDPGFDSLRGVPAVSDPFRIDVSLALADASGLDDLRGVARSFAGEDLKLTEIGSLADPSRLLKVRVPPGKVPELRAAVHALAEKRKDKVAETKLAFLRKESPPPRDERRAQKEEAGAEDLAKNSAGASTGAAAGASPSEEAERLAPAAEKPSATAKGVVRLRTSNAPAKPAAVPARPAAPAATAPKAQREGGLVSGDLVTVEIWVNFQSEAQPAAPAAPREK